MAELFEAYVRTRSRMIDVVRSASADEMLGMVPACPEWTVADLVAHCTGIPAALSAGDYPSGDQQAWLDGLVASRRGLPMAAVIEEWLALDESLKPMLGGPAGLLFDDLAVHEHDLRGALGRADHGALEVDVVLPRTLAGLAEPLRAAGLGAIEVRDCHGSWRSHDVESGWVLLTTPWEAARAVNSRRTPDELREIPHEGDVEAFLVVLDEHLPLPSTSLGER